MTRARLTVAAALLALAASAALVVFAVDVLRWDRSLAEQDVRFLASPKQARFSAPPELLPFGIAERTLDGSDDLVFRRELQAFARVRPGAVFDAQQFEALRSETQVALARLSRVDPDPQRRSRAANMIGVLALDPQLAPTVQEELANLLRGATDSFRNAVEIDPSNADAKRNLELALRIPGAAFLPGDDPSGTQDAGELAGLGNPGSGY
jgi:hypothetical protein